ncbi:MAG TPA: DsrE family protein [Burkholderiales bacterium]|nr:DsrE family protein [Burkholderiales bacterium]
MYAWIRAIAMVAMLSLAGMPLAQAQAPKQRVVFQMSDGDPAKWNLALNNIRNVQEDLGGGNVEIELVAYGAGGIGMLKLDSEVANRIADALSAGVKVLACENTMRGQKLTRSDMLPNIGYVRAGVMELIERQREGWAYIRP